jgi:hypothetical protein
MRDWPVEPGLMATRSEAVSATSSWDEAISRRCWIVFCLVCAAVLLPLLIAGISDRESLESVLREGGVVESLPAVLFVVAALLSVVVAVRSRALLPWGPFALACVFLAGEETGWGAEVVLGWDLQKVFGESDSADLHGSVSQGLGDLFGDLAPEEVPAGLKSIVYGLVFLSAGLFLSLGVLLGVLGAYTESGKLRLQRLGLQEPSRQFALLGVGLLLFGNIDILEEAFDFPYMPGVWPLEESFEVLGATALLIAVVARWWAFARRE